MSTRQNTINYKNRENFKNKLKVGFFILFVLSIFNSLYSMAESCSKEYCEIELPSLQNVCFKMDFHPQELVYLYDPVLKKVCACKCGLISFESKK